MGRCHTFKVLALVGSRGFAATVYTVVQTVLFSQCTDSIWALEGLCETTAKVAEAVTFIGLCGFIKGTWPADAVFTTEVTRSC